MLNTLTDIHSSQAHSAVVQTGHIIHWLAANCLVVRVTLFLETEELWELRFCFN